MDEPKRERKPVPVADLVHSMETGINEYEGLNPKIQCVMSFGEFIHLKERHETGVGTMQKVVGKVTLPYFDGSTKSLARAWVQKMDTYLHLNPMRETNAI